jgi:hypothetical protein
MHTRLHLVFLSLFAASRCLTAATLRVPQDYDVIQRAIWAAAPGDTITVSPGEYREEIVLPKRLVLQGAGVGKTVIIGPDRHTPVISSYADSGVVVIRDLTVKHVPATPSPPPAEGEELPIEASAPGVSGGGTTIHVLNVAIENVSGPGISLANFAMKIDNVTISGSADGALTLYKVPAETTVRNVSIRETRRGAAILLMRAGGTFANLQLDGSGDSLITVQGRTSAPKFKDLPADALAKISWQKGASPKGPIEKKPDTSGSEDEVLDLEDEEMEMDPQSAARQADRDRYQSETEPVRRELAAKLQKNIRAANTASESVQAVRAYIAELLSTYHPGESFDVGVNLATRAELRTLFERHGADALLAVQRDWPTNEENPVFDFASVVPPDVDTALTKHRQEHWLAANKQNIETSLLAWRKADEADRAKVFHKSVVDLQAILSESADAPDSARDHLRQAVLGQVPDFIGTAGYAALAAFLRSMADQPVELLSAPEVQDSLTPEQKRQLLRVMRTAK